MRKKLDFIIVICYTKVRFGRPPAIFLQGETGRMGEHASTAKDRIIDSFLSFYEHKPLQDIFVSDICADCGISRGTFYYHFTDVYDLCEQLENGLIRDMEADLSLSIMYTTAGRHREPDDQRYIKAYEECLKKYVDKADFYHVLLSGLPRRHLPPRMDGIGLSHAGYHDAVCKSAAGTGAPCPPIFCRRARHSPRPLVELRMPGKAIRHRVGDESDAVSRRVSGIRKSSPVSERTAFFLTRQPRRRYNSRSNGKGRAL